MILSVINHDFRYETEKLCRIFLPFEKIEIIDTIKDDETVAVTRLDKGEKNTGVFASLKLFAKSTSRQRVVDNNEKDYTDTCERELATCLYECFCEITGYTPPWGILTGVRPAKLYSRLFLLDGAQKTDEYFKSKLLVTDSKLSLCKQTRLKEESIVSLSRPESFSLYIAIPFCPSRCSYCSFVSHSVEHAKKLIPQYVELLCEEIKVTADIARKNGLRLETIYMGGGTPTTLTAEQMNTVLRTVRENFDLSHLREFTVEAGRPDTITEEKLQSIKQNGVDRISINPQTMNDDVLAAIGRRHTAQETVEAFNLARHLGFNNINMDLIAGLPSDTVDSFSHTLGSILSLSPESVTVHSLAMKRASKLSYGGATYVDGAGVVAGEMVNMARSILEQNGIMPYYMYRQSKTVGNLENVGYSKPGSECLYNVYIMDETHTILACGASGTTKLKEPNGNYIERIFNYKYPYEYITRFDELIDRKARVNTFYETYR